MALILDQSAADWVFDQLKARLSRLRMSTVNYAEVLILVGERYPEARQAAMNFIEHAVKLVPPSARQAELVALARLRYPLNLGDCFAYALAKEENCPLLTLDRDFRNCDVKVILPR